VTEELQVPADFDWYLWRLVLSPKIGASLHEIENDWTIDRMAEAHLALDLAEDLETLIERRLTPDPAR
jgi:hypothetical protein